jgi:hypothetical protein
VLRVDYLQNGFTQPLSRFSKASTSKHTKRCVYTDLVNLFCSRQAMLEHKNKLLLAVTINDDGYSDDNINLKRILTLVKQTLKI